MTRFRGFIDYFNYLFSIYQSFHITFYVLVKENVWVKTKTTNTLSGDAYAKIFIMFVRCAHQCGFEPHYLRVRGQRTKHSETQIPDGRVQGTRHSYFFVSLQRALPDRQHDNATFAFCSFLHQHGRSINYFIHHIFKGNKVK